MSDLRGDDFNLRARPGSLRSAGHRADQAVALRVGSDRGGQDAGNRRDRAVETEFAEHGEAGERVVRDGADGGHQSKRDRQIVVAAFLRQIGWREIDGDAPRR
jgi:hypothetical protein